MLGLTLGPQFKRTRLGLGVFHRPSYAEATLASATVLNDYSTPTFTRASTAYDPYNRVIAISGARRRRPLALSPTLTVYADLIEGARTNLVLQSQTFQTTWTLATGNPTVTADAGTAPDGTATADRLTEGTANGNQAIVQSVTKAASALTYAASVYVKLDGGTDNVILLLDDGAGNGTQIAFNATTGASLSSASGTGTPFTNISGSSSDEGSGWFRYWIVGTSNTAPTLRLRIAFWNGSSISFSGSTSNKLLLWGAQIEVMPASSTTGFPSSYIATTSATVTRAADALSVPYVLGQTGTILALCMPAWTGDQDGVSVYTLWRADDTNASRADRTGANGVALRRCDAGGNESTGIAPGFLSGGLSHIGTTWDAAALSGFVQGVANGTPDTTLTAPYQTNTLIRIGNAGGSGQFNGHVALLAWTPALSATQLSAIYAAFPTA